MRMRTIEISVGAFMLAGIVSLMALAIKVSGFNVGTSASGFNISARFDNVSGLTVRAKVTVGGVTVGQVAKIELDQEDYTAIVTMVIDSDVTSLTRDTSAAILTEGLLGGKYIGLAVGADEDFLTEGDEITDTQSSLVLEELIGEFLLKAIDG